MVLKAETTFMEKLNLKKFKTITIIFNFFYFKLFVIFDNLYNEI